MPHTNKTFGIIGAGNISECLLRGIIKHNILSINNIFCSDPLSSRHKVFQDLSLNIGTDNHIPASCNIVLLAVKPQVLFSVLTDIKNYISSDSLVISVAAGIKLEKISALLSAHSRIARVMPNTPLFVNAGMSAVAYQPGCTEDDKKFINLLFSSLGKIVTISESLMDTVTAVSGSGPGYLCFLAESFIKAALSAGCSLDLAKELVVQTFYGTACMLDNGFDPSALRKQVTSPNGTTMAGLEVFKNYDIDKIFIEAVKAAKSRSEELGE